MTKEEKKEYDKKRYSENKDKLNAASKKHHDKNKAKYHDYMIKYRDGKKTNICIQKKEYYTENKTKLIEYSKEYHNCNREKKAEYEKKYRESHKKNLNEKRNINTRNRRKNDSDYAVKIFLRASFKRMTKEKSGWRAFFELSGYSRDDYISHFASNYKDEFELYRATNKYHIDHIIPVSSYDFTLVEDIKNCWNPRNLRIIDALENIKKHNKMDYELISKMGICDLLPKGGKR